jgi:hypothetical protein
MQCTPPETYSSVDIDSLFKNEISNEFNKWQWIENIERIKSSGLNSSGMHFSFFTSWLMMGV